MKRKTLGRTSFAQTRRALKAAVVALFLALFLLTPRLFSGPLRHWDEAWYAQVSREMLQSGDWATPCWNGAPWFHKPPLAFWATAGIFSLLGVSEWSARLFSVGCGVLIAVILAAFAGWRRSARTGVAASLILLAIPEFVRYCGQGQLDSPLTLATTIQLICFWNGLRRPGWHWLGGLAFGAAILIKGAAAGLALIVEFAYLLVARDHRCLRQRAWWGASALGLILAAPWHIQQWLLYGDQFLQEYGCRHFTQFFASIAPGSDAHGPPWNYYITFLLRSEPWGPALLAFLPLSTLTVWARRDRLLTFAWCWAAAVPVALSCSQAKWNWYLMPSYPGAALLAALLVSRSLGKIRPHVVRAIWPGLVAAAASGHFLWIPKAKEGEAELKQIAPLVRRHVAPNDIVFAVQLGRVKRSVYPIATLFYSERKTYTIHSLDQFAESIELAGRPVYALARANVVAELAERGGRDGLDGYSIETVGAEGTIRLLRATPRSNRLKAAGRPKIFR